MNPAAALPATVDLAETPEGPVVVVDHPRARGAIHLHGAHVTSWIPQGHDEQLWLSPLSAYGPGAAIRGGIPVCFPWFAKGPGDWEPQHGFGRVLPWQLAGAEETTEGATVRLRLTSAEVPDDTIGRDRWPYPFAAEITVQFAAALTIGLTVSNTGVEPMPLGGALHTYLATPDITRTQISGLDGATYFDKVDGIERQQHGPVTFTAETDRLYHHNQQVRTWYAEAPTHEITTIGGSTIVVWNPWRDKARAMEDFPDDAWQEMFCVEAANPHDPDQHLAPGSHHSLTQVIRPLPPVGP